MGRASLTFGPLRVLSAERIVGAYLYETERTHAFGKALQRDFRVAAKLRAFCSQWLGVEPELVLLQDALQQVLQQLEEHGVAVALLGGLAVSGWTEPRFSVAPL